MNPSMLCVTELTLVSILFLHFLMSYGSQKSIHMHIAGLLKLQYHNISVNKFLPQDEET